VSESRTFGFPDRSRRDGSLDHDTGWIGRFSIEQPIKSKLREQICSKQQTEGRTGLQVSTLTTRPWHRHARALPTHHEPPERSPGHRRRESGARCRGQPPRVTSQGARTWSWRYRLEIASPCHRKEMTGGDCVFWRDRLRRQRTLGSRRASDVEASRSRGTDSQGWGWVAGGMANSPRSARRSTAMIWHS